VLYSKSKLVCQENEFIKEEWYEEQTGQYKLTYKGESSDTVLLAMIKKKIDSNKEIDYATYNWSNDFPVERVHYFPKPQNVDKGSINLIKSDYASKSDVYNMIKNSEDMEFAEEVFYHLHIK